MVFSEDQVTAKHLSTPATVTLMGNFSIQKEFRFHWLSVTVSWKLKIKLFSLKLFLKKLNFLGPLTVSVPSHTDGRFLSNCLFNVLGKVNSLIIPLLTSLFCCCCFELIFGIFIWDFVAPISWIIVFLKALKCYFLYPCLEIKKIKKTQKTHVRRWQFRNFWRSWTPCFSIHIRI